MSKDGYRMPAKPFTDKHKELFPYLAQGMNYAEIARALGITPMSVRQHVDRMMDIAKCTELAELETFCKQQVDGKTT